MQLLWVAAAYGLLRTLGLVRARAGAWVAVMALSGFFLQNSVFTWPKLAAAAFACAAFALWLRPTDEAAPRARLLCGAGLAALAWLAHCGVAFSLLAVAPWILWRARRRAARDWALAAAVFALLALPWFAYQKYSDPPGNRLAKMHLAGQAEIDSRGTWQTIEEAYLRQPWRETAAAKLANFKLLVVGDWRELFDPSAANAAARRGDEFYHIARALTWWLFGLAALPLLALRRNARARFLPHAHFHFSIAAWTALTVVIWCLLMFGGGQTVIHQGSYAVMLALFALLAAWLDCAGRGWIVVIAALQAMTLVTTWARANSAVDGRVSITAVALTLVGAVALAAFVVRGLKAESPAPSAQTRAPRLRVRRAATHAHPLPV